ncbi:hypothetical protein FRC17_002337 [Serendipita sp. 399]|nr:hypothetical protein FRC17_002337 [Serendipita sp. 399]
MDPFARLDAIVSQYLSSFSANKPVSSTSAFVQAVANAPSTDFIRAANPAQASVYSINVNTLNASKAGELEVKEVRRKTVAVATPLKKAGTSKPRKSRAGSALDDENDPEVPLRAALKLIDMFPESVDTKLRDKIIVMIDEDRDQAERIRAYMRPKQKVPLTQDEQTRIRSLEDEVRQLEEDNAKLRFKASKNQVDAKIRAETARQFELAEASINDEDSPIANRRRERATINDTLDDDETINFQKLNLVDNSLLMDTDTPNISQLIAQTPMKLDLHGRWDRKEQHMGEGEGPSGLRTPPPREDESIDESHTTDPYDESYAEDDTMEPDTIKVDLSGITGPPSPPVLPQRAQQLLDTPNEKTMNVIRTLSPSPPSTSPPNVTPEVEIGTEGTMSLEDTSKMRAYTTKIWSIAGDTLVPNNQYEASKGLGTKPTPDFKQTRTILQSIIDEPSPSNASAAEIHRVLTAALLHFLTDRDSSTVDNTSDAFSSTMIEARELLNSIIADRGWKKENKVIFTWVGKKLLKSDGGRRLRCNLD